jgi:hypothetical protein
VASEHRGVDDREGKDGSGRRKFRRLVTIAPRSSLGLRERRAHPIEVRAPNLRLGLAGLASRSSTSTPSAPASGTWPSAHSGGGNRVGGSGCATSGGRPSIMPAAPSSSTHVAGGDRHPKRWAARRCRDRDEQQASRAGRRGRPVLRLSSGAADRSQQLAPEACQVAGVDARKQRAAPHRHDLVIGSRPAAEGAAREEHGHVEVPEAP